MRNANTKTDDMVERKKICPCCGRELLLSDFYLYSNGCTSSRCKECMRKQSREAYARTRKVKDGIRKGDDGRLVEHKNGRIRLYWGELKIAQFKKDYPFMRNDDLAVKYDCSFRTVIRRAREMGLEKDKVWLRNVYMSCMEKMRFVNKVYGIKYDRDQVLRAGLATRFGNRAPQFVPPEVRSERIRKGWITRRKKQNGTQI